MNYDVTTCWCGGLGFTEAAWAFGREDECTCGAGDPRDLLVMHDARCDAVPCPFCPQYWEEEETA